MIVCVIGMVLALSWNSTKLAQIWMEFTKQRLMLVFEMAAMPIPYNGHMLCCKSVYRQFS